MLVIDPPGSHDWVVLEWCILAESSHGGVFAEEAVHVVVENSDAAVLITDSAD